MKKIKLKSESLVRFCYMTLFLSALIFGLILTPLVQAPPATTMSVFPSTVTACVGQNFTIDVKIADVLDLYGWEFKLGWTPALLDVVSIIEGPFLKQSGTTFFTSKVNNTEGYILVDCTLLGSVPGVSGSGTLATVEFGVKDAGETALNLYDTKLVNSWEQYISHDSVDGYGYFTVPHDVASVDVIAYPTTVLPGQLVQINATVQNQGSYAESFTVTSYYDSNIIQTQPVSLGAGASTNLTFTWNTTGVGKGDYTVSTEASVVAGETDTSDNTKAAESPVTVLSPGHDVAIRDVEPSKTAIGKGYPLSITVMAKNYGSSTETFNVTAYYNGTNPIAIQTITLTSGNSTTVTFTWNTADLQYGHYTISATATPVPSETDTTDNTCTDGWVLVSIPGDVDGDRDVDVGDQRSEQLAMFTTSGDPRWNPNADIDGDGDVDIGDQRKQQLNMFKSW